MKNLKQTLGLHGLLNRFVANHTEFYHQFRKHTPDSEWIYDGREMDQLRHNYEGAWAQAKLVDSLVSPDVRLQMEMVVDQMRLDLDSLPIVSHKLHG